MIKVVLKYIVKPHPQIYIVRNVRTEQKQQEMVISFDIIKIVVCFEFELSKLILQ